MTQNPRPERPSPVPQTPSPQLGVATIAALAGWLLTQLVFGSVWSAGDVSDQYASPTPRQLATIALLAPAAGLAAGLWALRHRALPAEIGFIAPTRRHVLFALLAALVVIPATYATLEASERLWTALQYEHADKHQLLDVMQSQRDLLTHVTITIAAVIVTPLFEELLFRGLLQTLLRSLTGNVIAAILISSALFTIIHDPWTQPAIFVLSIGIAVAYAITRNLWTAVIIHAIFNALSVARIWTG